MAMALALAIANNCNAVAAAAATATAATATAAAQPLAGVWDVAYGSSDYQRIQQHDEAAHGKALKKEGGLEDSHTPHAATDLVMRKRTARHHGTPPIHRSPSQANTGSCHSRIVARTCIW